MRLLTGSDAAQPDTFIDMSVLVTGGAGYIGSVAVEDLRLRGDKVVVVDNLVYGHRQAVHPDIPFYEGSIGNGELIAQIIDEHGVEDVMHFSAYAYVGESVKEPGKYFENNVVESSKLLRVLSDRNVGRFVFSSTCATYGEPLYSPIDEKHRQEPTNPYGWSKLFVEKMLDAYDTAHGMRSVSLRYFNAAGATRTHGEHHEPETHLIPLALAAAAGTRDSVSVYGTDYPTRDGTAVRDFVHVSDISRAHILSLDHLRAGGGSDFFNLGSGNGYTVREVLEAAREVTGCDIPYTDAPRREGDPSELVADAAKARGVLGWNPELDDINEIIRSAWEWHKAHPRGYEKQNRKDL